MEFTLAILTSQTNNNTKNMNLTLGISTCQLFKSTLDRDQTLQYPHTKFKHTLNLGPNLAILAFQNQNTHYIWDPTLQYLHFKLKHTLDMGFNQAQYLHFKLKHILDLGSNLAISIFRINNYM
jgi:hypothetical protein